jgi:hypothetical protein
MHGSKFQVDQSITAHRTWVAHAAAAQVNASSSSLTLHPAVADRRAVRLQHREVEDGPLHQRASPLLLLLLLLCVFAIQLQQGCAV